MIRPATSSDLKAVYDLVNETSECDLNFQMFAQTFVNQLNTIDRKLGVYEEEGKVIGFVGILCTWQLHAGERLAETKELTVAKAHQDKDIRDQLLAWAEQVARDAGCGRITMCSRVFHESSHRFYESNGFEKTYYRFDKKII
ncbi:GNAT family N-acetyltransferase [Bifidobacterium oedipodis]|uniref:GNAT family N-acetyltransferase n=1 Tax=Bifidobacterium oedipodis TaxID=2675322 RepID=A0A7Y0EQD1_9BIFI|nr:GNAT family N-acetyltransferase [Bifidobacterium sp. DSM 109957]NMM94449.1 GNAT family N-acetyltransferase [Bifidobacterium sp. DSM 109957]